MYYVDAPTLEQHSQAWDLDTVRQSAQVRSADEPCLTLGVRTGSLDQIKEQVADKAKVVQAIQEKVAVCADVQTEHVLNRQSLGIGRVNHILRVHGHSLVGEGGNLGIFDQCTREAMDRLFPGLTPEAHEQATLAAVLGGLGWRRASDIAQAANLGALVAATPKVRSMAQAAVQAGLLPERGGREAARGEDTGGQGSVPRQA